MFWGLSEGLDLLGEYLNIFDNANETAKNEIDENNEENKKHFKKELNILIFGGNDPRHIIKTMAKLYSHNLRDITPILNFYLVDGCIEVVARNMILLSIALENPGIINLRTKVHLFMDVFGNALMRAASYSYVTIKAKSLIKAITDEDYLKKITPMLNIDHMKYRERDGLENSFNFWLSMQGRIFKIQEYWNARVRKVLGTRYDFRQGQFDWDLNMVLKDRGGKQICSQEYRYWRETGIAFTFPEYEYSKPNKTLSAGLIRNGQKFIHRGYVGDIQTGPFTAFGLKSSDARITKSFHGENNYRSTDITERNLLELFHELATQTSYDHDTSLTRKYGGIRLKMGKNLIHNECDTEAIKKYDKPWIFIHGIKIHFLSTDDILGLSQNYSERWTRFFDIAFVGHNYFTFLKENFINVLAPQSLLIMETKLMSTCRKEDINKFEEQIFNYAKRNNLQNVINNKSLNSNNSIVKFKRFINISE